MMTKEMVRFIRRTANITQEEFAEKVGYSKAYVGYLEQGLRPVSKQAEDKIKQAFNISDEELAQFSLMIHKMKTGE